MYASPHLQAARQRQLLGLAAVVVLHGLLFWALQSGLSRTVMQKMPTVVQALLLQEKRPEPPPLPPARRTRPLGPAQRDCNGQRCANVCDAIARTRRRPCRSAHRPGPCVSARAHGGRREHGPV